MFFSDYFAKSHELKKGSLIKQESKKVVKTFIAKQSTLVRVGVEIPYSKMIPRVKFVIPNLSEMNLYFKMFSSLGFSV